jgi:hypothetical protein
MATADIDNVIPLQTGPASEPQPGANARPKDSTSALRSKRYRRSRKRDGRKAVRQSDRDSKRPLGGRALQDEKHNEIKPSDTVSEIEKVPFHYAQPLVPDLDVRTYSQRHGRGVTFATLTAALALAAVSGGFSITGMTSIFVGAFWPVIGMGIALEVGKLAAVAWLGHQRGTASWRLRAALTVLVAVLMGLNAVGCYGFLAKAHIGHLVEGDVAVAGRAADIEGRISVQTDLVADLDRRIGQIDGAVEKSTAKGRTNAAMQLAADQRRNRAEFAAQRDQANKVLAELKVEKAKVEGDRKVVEADLGPVRYLATLLGAGDQDVLRWFILVIAVLLDPAAVLLLLAATRR